MLVADVWDLPRGPFDKEVGRTFMRLAEARQIIFDTVSFQQPVRTGGNRMKKHGRDLMLAAKPIFEKWYSEMAYKTFNSPKYKKKMTLTEVEENMYNMAIDTVLQMWGDLGDEIVSQEVREVPVHIEAYTTVAVDDQSVVRNDSVS